jgi:hypothetical protein
MNYWLFMFRPDTYEKVKAHQTVGVRHSNRRRFAKLAKGDRFVTYVSRAKLVDGYGQLTGDPFEDDTLIFAEDQVYRQRCKVDFETTGVEKPAGDVLWGLSPFQGSINTTPTNLIFCKGGFIEISADDYRWLVDWLDSSD